MFYFSEYQIASSVRSQGNDFFFKENQSRYTICLVREWRTYFDQTLLLVSKQSESFHKLISVSQMRKGTKQSLNYF